MTSYSGISQLSSLVAPNENYQGIITPLVSVAAYSFIESASLGGLTEFTFSNIPTSFNDLRIVYQGASTVVSGTMFIRFNSNANLVYDSRRLEVFNGVNFTLTPIIDGNALPVGELRTDTVSTGEIMIYAYSKSGFNRLAAARGGDNSSTFNRVLISAGIWKSTAPVTSVSILMFGQPFASNSSAQLYGMV